MAYLLNTFWFVSILGADEHGDLVGQFTDDSGRVMTYDGDEIKLDLFNTLLEKLADNFHDILRDEIFFGNEVPDHVDPGFELKDISDNPQNRALGFCFLDHPRNPFGGWKTLYGEWILSDPARAARFTYIHEGRVVWLPGPSLELMAVLDRATDIMALRCVFGAGGSGRATEIAAETLRNKAGCTTRNVLFLYHVLTLMNFNDKTSHKRLKERYIPHAPPASVSYDLVWLLALIRPFQTFLAHQFLGADHAQRFHESLWPHTTANLSSLQLSSLMGDATEAHVKVRLPMTKYRKVVATFSSKNADPREYELAKSYFFDIVEHHSGSTANAVYQQDGGRLAGVSPQHIVGCIKYCIQWHALLGIDNEKRLSVTSVGLDDQGLPPPDGQESSGASIPPHLMGFLQTNFPGEATSWIDIPSVVRKIAGALIPRIEATIDERMESSALQSQALYWPPPPHSYADHALPPISSIQPHPSRVLQLRKALGAQEDFWFPEQAIFLERMIQGRGNHLIIMQCCTGKTRFAMIYALIYAASRVTVFILPHSGLHEDFRRRSREMGLTASKWEPNDAFNPDVQMLFVAVEHTDFDSFQR